jgi:hypothetical protein
MSEHTAPQARRPWGAWASLGLAVAVLVAFAAVQAGVVVWLRPYAEFVAGFAAPVRYHGLLIAAATLIAAPLGVALVVLCARARRGPRVRDYLALHAPPARRLAAWLALALVAMAAVDALLWLGGHEAVPQFMREAYLSAGVPALFWLAVVVAAPLFEELLFRGFLFAGLRRARPGAGGAILVSAVAWSAIHTQYEPVHLAAVFAGGLLLGVARERSGSTVVAILIHALWNLAALLETHYALAAA